MRAVSTLAFVLLACGNNDVHHLGDGGNDGPQAIDAQVDAAPLPVTIAVTLFDAPSAGNTVYFQDVNNTVVLETTTGSDGTASTVMAAGGYVTLIEPPEPSLASPSGQTLATFAGVKPGDVLHVDLGGNSVEEITISLTAPVDPNPNAVSYRLSSTCNGGAQVQIGNGSGSGGLKKKAPKDLPSTFVFLDGLCTTADMLVTSFDANGAELDSFFSPAIAVSNGATINLTGTYAAIPTQTVTFTNIPDSASFGAANLGHFIVTSDSAVLSEDPQVIAGSDQSISSTFGQPAVTGGIAGLEIEVNNFASQNIQTFSAWGPEVTTAVSVDFTAASLPDYVGQPTFDATTQQLQWSNTGGGSGSIDVVDANVTITDAPGDGGFAQWQWEIVAPGSENGALQFPVLPMDVSAFNPTATDTVNANFLAISHVTGGYDAVRASGLFGEPDVQLETTTPTGAVVIDQFQQAVTLGAGQHAKHRAHARARR